MATALATPIKARSPVAADELFGFELVAQQKPFISLTFDEIMARIVEEPDACVGLPIIEHHNQMTTTQPMIYVVKRTREHYFNTKIVDVAVAMTITEQAIDDMCSKMTFTKVYRGNCIWDIHGMTRNNTWYGNLYKVTMEKYPRGHSKFGKFRIEYLRTCNDPQENKEYFIGRHMKRKLKEILPR